ncbi:MAG: hypothetical protein FWH57_04660 [Oscillospiraceae bacterium]|nr:hypothetical protein [Oscillospiraceae bacterium]
MFCYKCGSPVGEGKKFCAKCGAPQYEANAAPQPETAYAPPAQTYIQPEPVAEYTPAQQEPAPYEPAQYEPTQYEPTPYEPAQREPTPYEPAPYESTPYNNAYAEPPSAAPQTAPQYYAPPPDTAPTYSPQPTQPGYPPPETAYAQPGSSYPGYPGYPGFAPTEPPQKKKAGKLLKFGVPITAVVAVAVVAVVLLLARASPKAVLGNALMGMVTEASSRIEKSPLKAIGMLTDTLKEGKLTVNFSYEDDWNDQDVRGGVAISSNDANKEYAIEANLDVAGFAKQIDAEVYFNAERIAIGSKLLDSNYYGLKYEGFRDDIQSFGELVGLDDAMMDQMADVVEMINKAMNQEGTNDETFKPYIDAISNFGNNVELTSEKTEVEIAGAVVNCQKISFVLTDKELIQLCYDLYDLLEADELIREQVEGMIDSSLTGGAYGGQSYDDMLKEVRNAIDEMERKLTCDITYTFIVDNRNRLLSIEVDSNVEFDGDRIRLRMSFDFGASAQDQWSCNMTVQEQGDRTSIKLVWEYTERANSIENSLAITSQDGDTTILRSIWSPERGNFTLSYEDQWGDGGEITGVFTANGQGFRLAFEDLLPPDSDADLNIELIGEPGASVKQISYINIDKWDRALLNKIEDLYYDLVN